MKKICSIQLWLAWLRAGVLLVIVLAAAAMEVRALLSPYPLPAISKGAPAADGRTDVRSIVQAVDAAFLLEWQEKKVAPAIAADSLSIARRLSLALTGSIPSLEEVRALEKHPEEARVDGWIDHLLKDRRSADYLAERLARVFVGTDDGAFLIFRRRRLVDWLSDQLHSNRPYDQIVRELIASDGVWTTHPEVNFVTATVMQKKGPDETKLTSRSSRAFLGIRMDCVQCHDGKLDNPWKQTDFHQMAAFFGQAEMSLTGLHDNKRQHYQVRYLRKTEEETVPAKVPWNPELLPEKGGPRSRFASWITDPGNRPFARAIVNRMWALMFNRPLVSPVDDIPLDGPFPPALELLADDFTRHGCDLQRLIRSIASTRVFHMSSRPASAEEPAASDAEKVWAVFPVTRLRPDQMAGSVIQASALSTLDANTQVLFRIKRSLDVTNFVKRYGDVGEDDFSDQSSTIPQRLLMMNGNMITDHLRANPLINASSRIAMLAPDDATAVDVAYLAALTRRPTPDEAEWFAKMLRGKKGNVRNQAVADLCWTLMNATEFSWNH